MSKKILKISTLSLVMVGCVFMHISYAGSFSKDKAGTTSAQFLKIGCGARAIAMGEAFSAVADDATAIYWNPAGLAQLNQREISAMHAVWLEDINYDFIAYAHPLLGGSIGASLNYLSMKEMDKLDEYGDKQGTFAPYDSAANIAYARKVGPVISGINLKFIQQEIDDETASAYAADIGFLYPLINHNMRIALVGQNIGTNMKFIEEENSLPLAIRVGLAYKMGKKLTLAIDGVAPIDNDPHAHVGSEYAFNVSKHMLISLRVGYKTTTISDLDALSGISGGVGCNLTGVAIDYAWVPYGDLGDTHRMSLGMKFGKSLQNELEQKISKMKNYYIRGVKYYNKGEYKRAITNLEKLLELAPNHKKTQQLLRKAQQKVEKISKR